MHKACVLLMFCFWLLVWHECPMICTASEQPKELTSDLTSELTSVLDIASVEKELENLQEDSGFSFSETVNRLMRGEVSFRVSDLCENVKTLFFREWDRQRMMALQILVIAVASAVFTNFIRIFDNNQIADISFYMMYLLICVLLMREFLTMNQVVYRTCSGIYSFMKVLLPVYLATVVFSAGSVSALGFYEICVLGLNFLQVFILQCILPAVSFYLMILLMNQMSQEDYFSRMAELIRSGIEWALKTILALIVGLQTLQCLVAPAIDSLKNTAAHHLIKVLPGVGTAFSTAAELVAGSAVLVKNSVGVTGILALAVLCLGTVMRLLAGILMFRLLCAAIQPVSERRLVKCIASISGATSLSLKILLTSVSLFIISIAMITAVNVQK